MGRDIALAGFVMTGDEWDSLDEVARAQLLAIALRRDEPWTPAAPPPRRAAPVNDGVPEPIDGPEPYAHYEVVLGAA